VSRDNLKAESQTIFNISHDPSF